MSEKLASKVTQHFDVGCLLENQTVPYHTSFVHALIFCFLVNFWSLLIGQGRQGSGAMLGSTMVGGGGGGLLGGVATATTCGGVSSLHPPTSTSHHRRQSSHGSATTGLDVKELRQPLTTLSSLRPSPYSISAR